MMNVQLLKWSSEFGIRCVVEHAVRTSRRVGCVVRGDGGMAAGDLPSAAAVGRQPRPLRSLQSLSHATRGTTACSLTPSRAYSYVYPLSADALMRLAYSFEDIGHQAHIHRSIQTGPGQNALTTMVQQWNDAWRFSPPELYVDDLGQRLRVTDTRSCATSRDRIIAGMEATVYQFCDSAQTPAALIRSGIPSQELERAVETLSNAKLLLRLNGRLLSLGVVL